MSRKRKQQPWMVYSPSSGRWLTTVYYDVSCDADYVRRSLIEHDGYPSDIIIHKE